MDKEPKTARKQNEKVEKETELLSQPDEKLKKRKRPPKNPYYKPTTVNIDDFRRRLRTENRKALRRAGIWLD